MLPKIIKFQGVTDAGEYGNATCPHCGASGRYIYHFVCVDGEQRGAMKGCLGKFPQHAFAKKHQRILDKQLQRKSLASWDVTILATIDDFAAGKVAENIATLKIAAAERQRDAWLKKSFGRR